MFQPNCCCYIRLLCDSRPFYVKVNYLSASRFVVCDGRPSLVMCAGQAPRHLALVLCEGTTTPPPLACFWVKGQESLFFLPLARHKNFFAIGPRSFFFPGPSAKFFFFPCIIVQFFSLSRFPEKKNVVEINVCWQGGCCDRNSHNRRDSFAQDWPTVCIIGQNDNDDTKCTS